MKRCWLVQANRAGSRARFARNKPPSPAPSNATPPMLNSSVSSNERADSCGWTDSTCRVCVPFILMHKSMHGSIRCDRCKEKVLGPEVKRDAKQYQGHAQHTAIPERQANAQTLKHGCPCLL